jgi:hypothetical protein
MNNMFKQNSRFGVLAGDTSTTKDPKNNNNKNNNKNKINEDRFKIEEDKSENNSIKGEGNSFKSEGNSFKKPFEDRPQRSYNNGYQRNSMTNRESKETIERRATDEKKRKEEHDKMEAEKLAKALCIDNFPSFGKKDTKNTNNTNNNDTNNNDTNNTNNNNTSFLAKLTTSIEDDKNNESKPEEIKPGWTTISRDPLTGKAKIQHGISIYKKREKTEQEIAYDMLNALCDLHERRTEEYIDLYGYETWEKIFKSPNWEEEEEYLERMEEEYEQELDKEMEEGDEYNQEYATDNDKHNRYWEHY